MKNDLAWINGALHARARPLEPGQYSRIAIDALDADEVVGQRGGAPSSTFSGWQVEAASPAGNASFGQYSVEELVELAPFWLALLALPAGWAFRVARGEPAEVTSPAGVRHALDLPPAAGRR